MNQITPEQALANLYNAARLARLTADEHAIIAQSAQVLSNIIKPPKEDKPE